MESRRGFFGQLVGSILGILSLGFLKPAQAAPTLTYNGIQLPPNCSYTISSITIHDVSFEGLNLYKPVTGNGFVRVNANYQSDLYGNTLTGEVTDFEVYRKA